MKRFLKRQAVIGTALVLLTWLGLEIVIRKASLPAGLGESRPSTVLLEQFGSLLAEIGNEDARSWRPVKLEEISPDLIRATLAAEDRRFYVHNGVDITALGGAVFRNLKSRKVVSGASTITQQLIKLHIGKSSRGWSDKVAENFSAMKLERSWSKRKILEAYLNRIDYGNRLRGIEAAAQGYFGKTASKLTAQESAFLAGLPQAPSRYNPWSNPAAAEARYRQVVSFLGGNRDPDLEIVPTIQAKPSFRNPAPHFTRIVASDSVGTVRTTLDSGLQDSVEIILNRHSRRLSKLRAGQIAAVVIDHQTGAVRAWCGSSDWTGRGGQIDGVVTPRSSGSTLKPFLYLRAIDKKILTAAILLPDTPDAIRAEYVDYDPRNYDERFWGPVRVREALANSLNVPAVYVLAKVGARPFYNYLQRSGIPLRRSLDDYGAGMILGNGEVRMLDLTSAFGAFANQGKYTLPRMLASEPQRHIAISSPEAANIVASILSDNDARLKTFGADSPLAFEDYVIPFKTGTSSGFHDAWTVGATGQHVVGVWVGNFDGTGMNEVASVTSPAPVWREFIDMLLKEDGRVVLDLKGGLVREEICSLSGLKWSEPSPGKLMETFLLGTEPKEDSPSFFENGKIRLPSEFALWCRSGHNYLGADVARTAELRIVNPLDGSTYLTDPGLPIERQQIELLATGGEERLTWEMDGLKMEAVESGSVFWQVEKGIHRVKATSSKGQTEAVFEVK
ncbi:MAG: penicillin-binding protein 1C [Verrucomicrobia bacterium]|jgi:penicillin-binding protein 1C|nr:penicillin-binding protein 1C [Verrucomicrobiota bacterium]|tara:strand:- start:1272 stop:3467 length:2196 start_codon:yes stop_codon:yes gene_type:complete